MGTLEPARGVRWVSVDDDVIVGEPVARPTVDVTGLDATGLTIGPDEILVLVVSRFMTRDEADRHRATIETVIPRDRYLLVAGIQVAKMPKHLGEQVKRELEAS